MNPQSTPTPEQQPVVPMVEIPQAPEVTTASAAPTVAQPATPTASPSVDAVMAAADAGGTPAVAAAPQPPVGPTIADDVDVIEKEWVDKTEDIIAKTAGDPHAEEEAIEDLTIDYMKKRYDKDIAKSGDQ
jgi:hypothetical protein